MFRRITVVAALATTATLGISVSPAFALRSLDSSGGETYTYVPPTRTMSAEKPHGDYGSGDTKSDCTRAVEAANSWLAEAKSKYAAGDATWTQAQNNADNLAGEANSSYGCTLTYAE
jgi:hypothetical protein